MPRYTTEQKSKWLSDWRDSGLSPKVFAQDKPFDASTLYYWNRKSEEHDIGSFIEISTGSPSSTLSKDPHIRLTYPTGVVLEVFDSVAIEDLKSLLC